MKRSFSLLICIVLAAVVARGQLRICGSCGREDTSGGAQCAVCQGPLPAVVTAAPADAVEAPAPASADDPVSAVAFEAVRQDVLAAREDEARRPEAALALYENARALLAVADPARLPPETGPAVLAGLQRCRAALAVAGQSCPACGGTGRQQITLLQLAGGGAEEAPTRTTGAACTTCGGRGTLTGNRDIETTRLLILQGRREAGLKLQAAGRAAAGRAWVPREWVETLTPMQTAAIRRSAAAACSACAGIGLMACRKCGGAATQPCANRACRAGWVEQKTANTLTPRTALTRRVPCPDCQGTTRVACSGCHGKGGVACTACRGTGLGTACRICGGEGTVVCRACRSGRTGADETVCASCKGLGRALCGGCKGDGVSAR